MNNAARGHEQEQPETRFVGFHLETAIHRDLKLASVTEQKTLRDCWREATLMWLGTDPKERSRLIHNAAKKLGYPSYLDDSDATSDSDDSDVADVDLDNHFQLQDLPGIKEEELQPLKFLDDDQVEDGSESEGEGNGLRHGDELIIDTGNTN